MKCLICAEREKSVYDHPVYKTLQERLKFAERTNLNDRNQINIMHNRIFNLELRILSLTRQLEDPKEP